jgi:hypothetical protein
LLAFFIMTPYQEAFFQLIQQRDAMYLQLFLAALVSWAWYRLWLKRFFKPVLAVAVVVFGAAWLWGVYQLLPKVI